MRRRDLLRHASAAAGSLILSDIARSSDSEQLNVTVRHDGRDYEYRMSSGKDLGDFTSQAFVQRCVRVDQPDLPLTIFFRPDADAKRLEVVFELGRMWGQANRQARHLGHYRATIRNGQTIVARVDVEKHWWFSRWRWQSAPRPLIATPADLIAKRLVPPYGISAATHAESLDDDLKHRYAGPMDNAGVEMQMGTTGDRPDIGPVTDYQAAYLITSSDDALAVVRAQAEAAGSIPLHFRDETTSAPVDFFRYPQVSWYDEPNGKPWVKPHIAIRDASGNPPCPWELSTSHDPALNYVPYLLTGDPYHLEELQFQGGQPLGWTSYHRAESGLQIAFPDDARSYAWSMRTLFQLAKVTPERTPAWLKPRSYWQAIVRDNLKWFNATYVNEPSPACSVFHSATGMESLPAWQEDFLATVFGWAVYMGFEDWRGAYAWKLASTLARTNGQSGWPRQWCTPFFIRISKSEPSNSVYARKSPRSIWYTSWKEAWEAYRADPEHNVVTPFADQTSWAQNDDPQLLIYTRGALAMATHLGIEAAREPFRFVDQMVRKRKFTYYKWAIEPQLK